MFVLHHLLQDQTRKMHAAMCIEGLTAEDISNAGVEEHVLQPFTGRDLAVAKGLLQHPVVKSCPAYEEQLQVMISMSVKVELQALYGQHLDYLSRVYLPQKLGIRNSNDKRPE